jgi:RNA polymerase sigma factor (sigma-70 family)
MGLALRALGQKHSATEHQLVAAVRQGDDRAFEELFSRYRSRITGYVLGMVRDHARAEDITQEVFLSALRRLRDSERPIAFKPWIYEIARNACIDEFRRTKRASEVSLNADDDSAAANRSLVSKQPTPDAAMENKQRLEALRGAFRGLSESHHRILVMRELEGLSYREIADRMGMSKPMVESALFRARRRLGEEFEELSSGRRCQQVCEVVERADASTIRVLGLRARRQVALHLSHCDDCRRHARLAGADEALFRAPTFADKVAALLPFGWLGKRLGRSGGSPAKPGAHGVLGKHAASVSQYVGSLGPSAVLGRVAAAVLVAAAAGGGYAGVSTIDGPSTPVHNAAASISASTVRLSSSGTAHKTAAVPTQRSLAASAAALRQPAEEHGGAANLTGAATTAGGGRGGGKPPRRTGHGGGSGGSGGGGSGSSSGGGSGTGGTRSGGPARRLLASSPAGGVLGPVLGVTRPITRHLPSLRKKASGVAPAPSSPTSVPVLPPPPSLPNPTSVVNQAGQTAGSLTSGTTKTVSGVLGH